MYEVYGPGEAPSWVYGSTNNNITEEDYAIMLMEDWWPFNDELAGSEFLEAIGYEAEGSAPEQYSRASASWTFNAELASEAQSVGTED
ncbi:hypothetical protein [Nesterenkonia alba]|uniref:hypothetical protein n=1 Tax=Nesterenkonia alba TaxID=515814 RepID=UPI0012EB7578|nr:hypothetical protein [Nesterenkonia alba]